MDTGDTPIDTNPVNPGVTPGPISPVQPVRPQDGQAGGQLGGISIGKELEPVGVGLEQPGLKDVSAKEIELPKEVVAAGVRAQPTTVPLPANVTKMGVTPVGDAVAPQTTTVVLPLTDDQIAVGLRQSIANSWRWLSEWCERRLKQLRNGVIKT
ncbi:hypothetical protein A2973_00185 [Candidatus Gottesmanbacteria bacterium RIFCSPLOWO2_01_FULL_49_10]|uniref:Uncharacterized protein n=1 Tax=Candidatus Gottesmanbacteria bacterium RIFCSPLOWO2_01_FULL_49_10 TaxID=1798396 RepID=A0A1F6AZ11_9BACT|nr:MAG: hypothetical protein A2973_00185 [Candidatus Gottesmanbacteria bacterium RIFCSPLOWO2_01_FULL_49_10]